MRWTVNWCVFLRSAIHRNDTFSPVNDKALIRVYSRLYTINFVRRRRRLSHLVSMQVICLSPIVPPIQRRRPLTCNTPLHAHEPLTILLGQSLESDLHLHALELSHPRYLDAALVFRHPLGRPLEPDWHGSRASGSAALCRIGAPAGTTPKTMRVHA